MKSLFVWQVGQKLRHKFNSHLRVRVCQRVYDVDRDTFLYIMNYDHALNDDIHYTLEQAYDYLEEDK